MIKLNIHQMFFHICIFFASKFDFVISYSA